MADDDETLDVLTLEDNLSDVEKPPELPDGRYTAEIQDVKVATSGKGNKYYSIAFVVPPSEMPEEIAEHYEDGCQLYWNRQLVPRNAKDRRTLFRLKQFLEAIGLDSNTTTIDPNEWMGCKARLTVKLGRYNGEDRPEIKTVDRVVESTKRAAAAEAAPAAAKRGRK